MSAPERVPDTCGKCGAPVWHARTTHDVVTPFDALPDVPDATWLLTYVRAAGELHAELAPLAAHGNGRKLYRTHYRTCTPAAEALPQPEEAPE